MSAGNGRVLIIEDDPAVSRAFERAIRKIGFSVETTDDGASAAQLLFSTPFDAVISDINVPGATGVDVLRTIRSYSLDVPVLLVTGDPTLSTAIEAVELGALRYLVKPVDIAILQKEVMRAVQLYRLAQIKRQMLREAGRGAEEPADLAGHASRFARALDQMWIAFQPIIDLKGSKLYGYEALLRSREPSLPGPLDVVAAAERLGKVLELGARVRERTAQALSNLKDDGVHVFVNLHPSELLDPSLYADGSSIMGIAPRVVLEVTERAALQKLHDLGERTSVLRFHGYRLAVDDLGAGYAGLSSFVALEPEFVKLDMSLVRGIDKSRIRQELLRSLVDLCAGLRIKIVGEGVETQSELDTLRELGCQLAQGYFLGRPAQLFDDYS
jgi:EAL domain-containing protein (putative c-di-GMP-specific phosphodiesterase class I)/ActR/RegA family two-component response regulator